MKKLVSSVLGILMILWLSVPSVSALSEGSVVAPLSAANAKTQVELRLAQSEAKYNKTANGNCFEFAKTVLSEVFGLKNDYGLSWNYHGNWKSDGSYRLNLVGRVTACKTYNYAPLPSGAFYRNSVTAQTVKDLFSFAHVGDVFQGCRTCQESGTGQHSAIIQAIKPDGVVLYQGNDQGYVTIKQYSYDYLARDFPHAASIYTAPNYASINKPAQYSVSFATPTVSSITANNAVLKTSVYRPTGVYVQYCGLYMGKTSQALSKVATEVPGQEAQNYPNYFNMAYDIKSETKFQLSSATQYYYKFFIIINGVEYQSSVYSFKTK